MPAYTSILTDAIDIGSPIRSVDMVAVRDNIAAVAEGNDTAPRVAPWALSNIAITAGTTLVFRNDFEHYTIEDSTDGDGSYAFWAQVFATGTIRMECSHRRDGGSGSSRMQFIRARSTGNTTIDTWTNGGSSFADRSADVSVLPGDTLFVVHRESGGATGSRAENFRLRTTGGLPLIIGLGGLVLPTQPSG